MPTPGAVLGAANGGLDRESGAEEHEGEDGKRIIGGLDGVHEVEVAGCVGDVQNDHGKAERDAKR